MQRKLENEQRVNKELRDKLIEQEVERRKQELIQKKIQEAKDKKIAELKKQNEASKKKDDINYDKLEVSELYAEVLKYIRRNNIDTKKPIDVNIITKKFGSNSVRRLVTNSYMFKTSKGLIVGKIK
jgi:hypothetical protein